MQPNKKELYRAYSPYRRETLYCVVIDIIIIALILVLFLAFDSPDILPLILALLGVFLLFEIFINYRLALLSLLEARKELFVFEDVTFISIKEDFSLTGRWENIIGKLYPSELGVDRYKIKCIDSNNKKLTLRCVMSDKPAAMLYNKINESHNLPRKVAFGKYSRIVVKFCDKDDLSFVLNRTL